MAKDAKPDRKSARFVRALRARAALTQEAFAARIGVTPVHVANLEAGRFGIGAKTKQGIEREFPASVTELQEIVTSDRPGYQAARSPQVVTACDDAHPEDEVIFNSLFLTYCLGHDRRPLYQLIEATVTATVDGVNGITVGYTFTGSVDRLEFRVFPPHSKGVDLPNNTVGAKRFNINFDKPLPKGGSSVVRYVYFFPDDQDQPMAVFGRGVYGETLKLVLRVEFSPADLPRWCRQRSGFYGEWPHFHEGEREVQIVGGGVATATFLRPSIGRMHVIDWEW